MGELIGTVDRYKNGLMPAGSFVKNYTLTFNGNGDGYKIGSSNADTFIFFKDGGYPCIIAITGNSGNNKYNVICGSLRPSVYEIKIIDGVACIISLSEEIKRHYKIFCVNGNTGFRNESRIFYFIHLQNEENYERKESSSAR
ncbi:hypothetical protein [Phocaeicola coprocola]|uniref:hypothetical protein n=1 Tax=Phocaeicola coprocola TaxID=310298 RepID=UPI001C390DF6|nr:hypothetical protein [Phocaeicola coprocola]MBV3866243.1 hypothetical protein [Phocaeicola coprocola]MBV4007467.1 hypothetical protein [Phocaeicola coprocola]MBV4031894.1 hypothetical protein [Phocaeicola coprocola]MBV4040784.1 hypothetical protein [Phocaeicola coprocola]MBV4060113.1 hypothetical protein [Phocaeicola coprocola]